MKKCSRCKEEKEVAEFIKNNQTKDGLTYYCKACLKGIREKYRLEYKDKIREYRRSWNAKNPDKCRLYVKTYRKKNPDLIASMSRRYQEAHPDVSRRYKKKSAYYIDRAYIISIICKNSPLKSSDIPPELIEVKRLIIKTKRLCKQQSQTSQNLETV